MRDRSADVIEKEFFRNGILFVDICSDGKQEETWVKYPGTKILGTEKWIAQAMRKAGREGSEVVKLIDDKLGYKAELIDYM